MSIQFTNIVSNLPASVPFVGPEAQERAIKQLRYEYPDLDQRLAVSKAQKSLTKEGNFNTVQYLINKFPK